MNNLTENDRLNLTKMLQQYNSNETTEQIRQLRHSRKIQEDVSRMIALKKEYSRLRVTNPSQFRTMSENRCSFLYNHYTNIFNRLLKDELNEKILFQFIAILSQIEEGKIDQHEGSYKVGMLLKQLYIDTALQRKKDTSSREKKLSKPIKKISWKEYKMVHLEK